MLTATGILSETRGERVVNSAGSDLVLWMFCVSTCHVEHRVVHTEWTVLPALPFPVHHDLHDFCPQRDVGGVDGHTGGGAVACLVVLTWDQEETDATVILQRCERKRCRLSVRPRSPTHGVPDVDVALLSPVVALREGLPIREHVAFLDVWTLSKAVIVQPGRPVVHVARAELPVGCSERKTKHV